MTHPPALVPVRLLGGRRGRPLGTGRGGLPHGDCLPYPERCAVCLNPGPLAVLRTSDCGSGAPSSVPDLSTAGTKMACERLPIPPPPPLRAERIGRAQRKLGMEKGTNKGRLTGQGRPRSPKTVQSAEGGEGKDKRERIIVVVRSPCQENYPADAHPSALKLVLESANLAWTRSVHLDTPGQRHGQQPVSGTANPGVFKQDKSFKGSVDTTKTRSGPQRVRMSSGERPIGTTKGKQPHTEALCQPPPPLRGERGLIAAQTSACT